MDSYVENRLAAASGHVGFYYHNLATGESLGYHETDLFEAASVIKLPILAAVFLRENESPGILAERLTVRDGDKLPGCGALQHLTGDGEYDILSLCKLMITISDNTATNTLIRRFGIDALNADFRRLGLTKTTLYRLLFDAAAAQEGKENLFEPLELARLLEKLYRKELISPHASEQMLQILMAQQINHKIPGRLPNLTVAHKTGEDDGITNDLGILFSGEPMLLAFASNATDVPAFEQTIRDVSYYFVRERK